MNEMEQRHREEIMDVLLLIFLKVERFCLSWTFCNAFILTYPTSFFFFWRPMILPFACAHKLMIMMYIFILCENGEDELSVPYCVAWHGGSIE